MDKRVSESVVIYIVDDDEAMRRSLAWLVESAGYRAHVYECARTFLADIDSSSCGCAILDVHMPGMDGVELHRQLIIRCPDMPVIFISGGPQDLLTRRAQQANTAGFYTKPLDTDILLDSIRKSLLH